MKRPTSRRYFGTANGYRVEAPSITIGSPVFPPARTPAPDAFTAAIALRDAARAHILAHCGEADAWTD